MELINTNILNYTTIKIRIIKDIWMGNEGDSNFLLSLFIFVINNNFPTRR